MEVDDEQSSESDILKEIKKVPQCFEHFLRNREISNNKRYQRTFNADFGKNDFCQKDIREHTGCINAIQFSHGEQLLASGGDDLHCRIWRVDDLMLRRNPKPITITTEAHESNIFSLEFDLDDRHIYSGERRGYIMKHDIETGQRVYVTERQRHNGDVYFLNHHPFDTHTLVATHGLSITILDDRDRGNQTTFLESDYTHKEFYTAEFHSESPVLLLINSENDGPNVYDRRNPRRPVYELNSFDGLPNGDIAWMGSAWSPSGNQFMAIRRAAAPIYFDLITRRCFELRSADSPIGYRNAKTIKSMTFIDDYTVATGSDHWGIHFWKCPHANDTTGFVQIDDENDTSKFYVEKELRVLRGHRSIPNQVRFSKHNQILVSSGVENSFKLWSHCRLPWSYDIPFKRVKGGNYDHTVELEMVREKEERLALENVMKLDGEMEGRACWEDVFGGDAQTAENRETLEMFDIGDEHDSDDDDDDDDDDDNLFHFGNAGMREVFRNLFRRREEDDENEQILRFIMRRERRDHEMNLSGSSSDEENDGDGEERRPEARDIGNDEDSDNESDDSEPDPIRDAALRFLEEQLDDDEEDDDEEVEGDDEFVNDREAELQAAYQRRVGENVRRMLQERMEREDQEIIVDSDDSDNDSE